MDKLKSKDGLPNVIATYKRAYSVKRHNEVVRGFAPYMARDVSRIFAEQYVLLRDTNFDDISIMEAFIKTNDEMQKIFAYYIAKVFIGGHVVACNKLGLDAANFGYVDVVGLEEANDSYSMYDDDMFNLKNPRAVEWAKKRAAEAVTGVNETTRREIKKIVSFGVDNGLAPGKIAGMITDKFIQFSVPIKNRRTPNRATLVAVTELANAYCEANLQLAKELQDAGVSMVKMWLTVGDDRVSDGCRENQDKGWIGIDEEFPSGHQRPPRFPGCRCDLLTDMKGFEDESTPDYVKRMSQENKEEFQIPSWEEWKSLPIHDRMRAEHSKHINHVYDSSNHYDFEGFEEFQRMYDGVNDWWGSLSDGSKESIREYTGDNYDPINGYLSGYAKKEDAWFDIEEEISNIEKALDAGVTQDDIVVVRRFNRSGFEDYEVGDTFSINQFLSTSIRSDKWKDRENVAYIYVPANIGKGAYLDGKSKYQTELEYLINRGQTFQLVAKRPRDSGYGFEYYLRLL